MTGISSEMKSPAAFRSFLPSGLFGFGFAVGIAAGACVLLLAA